MQFLPKWITRLFSKSLGEKRLMAMFPGWGTASTGWNWSAQRLELVQHFTGWNYVAINAICEEIAGLSPTVAYRRIQGAGTAEKYLRWAKRCKAIANLQTHEEIEPADSTHPLARLLSNPNGPDVAWTFFYKWAMYLKLTGNCYVWVIPDKSGARPAELWVLPSQWVRAKPGGGGQSFITEYEIRPVAGYVASELGLGWYPGGGYGGTATIPAKYIIPFQYPNPINFWDGYAPTTAIAHWIDAADSIDRSRTAQFQNGMFPGVVLEIDKEASDPGPEEAARIKQEIRTRYSGVRKSGEPLVLFPGIKLVPMSLTPTEMAYDKSGDQVKEWIMAAHKVGPSIIGMTEQANLASATAVRASFHQIAIKPALILAGQVFTEKLAREWYEEEDLFVYWDDPTPADPAQRMAELNAQFDRGVITPNEYRAEIGREAYEHGGDDPMVPMTLSPIPLATGDGVEDLPVPAVAGERWDPEQQGDQHNEFGGGAGGDKPDSGLVNGDGKHLNGRLKGLLK